MRAYCRVNDIVFCVVCEHCGFTSYLCNQLHCHFLQHILKGCLLSVSFILFFLFSLSLSLTILPKQLWSHLATQGTSHLDWQSILLSSFSEYTMPGDEALDSQIVKDLHRTGNTGFTTEEEHGILKRVLLAYARYNKATGYCQGFNILAALILKVVGFDEHLALKVKCQLPALLVKTNFSPLTLSTHTRTHTSLPLPLPPPHNRSWSTS